MKPGRTLVKTLSNGMKIAAAGMEGFPSGGFSLYLPLGSVTDPDGASGSAAVIENLLLRGGGGLSAEELASALDGLGLVRSVSSGTEYAAISGASTRERIPESLRTISRTLLDPLVTKEDFDASVSSALHSLDAIEDNPSSRVIYELAKLHYPYPLTKRPEGVREEIEGIEYADLKSDFRRRLGPDGAILAMAGGFDPEKMISSAEKLFESWNGGAGRPDYGDGKGGGGIHRIETESEQVRIAFAFRAPVATDELFMASRIGVLILSGGMGARLFVEVREKRGLVYSVSASMKPLGKRSDIFAYAGTTPEKVGETLDVMTREVAKMVSGIKEEEVTRAKVKMRTDLAVTDESAWSKANLIAWDLFARGRVRSRDEIIEEVEAVTPDKVEESFAAYPPRPETILLLGPLAGVDGV